MDFFTNMSSERVVGAGISGLASAYLLAKQGKRVTLFDSEDKSTVDTKEVGPIDLGFQARWPRACGHRQF